MNTLPRRANQNSPQASLVLGRILADDEDSGATVEPPAVKDRPPFDPEILQRMNVTSRIVGDQRREGFAVVAWAEGIGMCPLARTRSPKRRPGSRGGRTSPQPKGRPTTAAIDRMVRRVNVSDSGACSRLGTPYPLLIRSHRHSPRARTHAAPAARSRCSSGRALERRQ